MLNNLKTFLADVPNGLKIILTVPHAICRCVCCCLPPFLNSPPPHSYQQMLGLMVLIIQVRHPFISIAIFVIFSLTLVVPERVQTR